MIRPDELMVGDFVCADNIYKNTKPLEKMNLVILQPYSDRGYIYALCGKGPNEYTKDEVYPITLTPEILKKSGFSVLDEEADPNSYFYSIKDKDIYIEYDFDLDNVMVLTPSNTFTGLIYNVHELQHALRLCKIDKEILL